MDNQIKHELWSFRTDVTEHINLNDEDAAIMGKFKAYDVYVYDSGRQVYPASITPAYEMWYAGMFFDYDEWPEDEDQREAMFDLELDIAQSGDNDVQYYNVSMVDQVEELKNIEGPSNAGESKAYEDEFDPQEIEDDDDYRTVMEDAIEDLRANSSIN